MHFVMHVFNNHVRVLHGVTPIDLLVQSAVLSDGVVFCVLNIFTSTNHTVYHIFDTVRRECRKAPYSLCQNHIMIRRPCDNAGYFL